MQKKKRDKQQQNQVIYNYSPSWQGPIKIHKELHNVACHFKNEQLSEGQRSKHRTRVHMTIAKNEESETQV